ncbi:MAG: DUF58 domain-containing protein [Myxococcota bacterium]
MTSLSTTLISPDELSAIESLQLQAREAVEGALAGMHRSQRRGSSIEFSEHKLYAPGDDIRHIDWRAFAKTDRYHVKQFEDETNLTLEILVDHSGSMGFQEGALDSKLDYAKKLAAALGYLALRQGDATGLGTFSGDLTDELPARSSSGHLLEILTRLTRLAPQGPTHVAAALSDFAHRSRRRVVAVVLSDLFDPDPALLDALRLLAAHRHDIAVLQILSPAELSFPYDAPAQFASMEDARKLFVHPRALRTTFVREMQEFLARTERTLMECSIDYLRVTTDEPVGNVLGQFLRRRAG